MVVVGRHCKKNHQKNKKLRKKRRSAVRKGKRSGAGRFKDASRMNRVPIVEAAPRGGSYAPKGVEKGGGCIVHPA